MSALERDQGLDSEAVVYEAGPFFKGNSMNLDKAGKFKRHFYPIVFFFKSLRKYDVYHFYFGTSFLMLGLDLPILRMFGKKIVMTYCGSEVRLMKQVEAVRNPYFDKIDFGRQAKIPNNPFVRWLKRQFIFRYSSPEFDQRKIRMMKWQNKWVSRFFVIRDCYAHVKNYIDPHKVIVDVPVNHISIKQNEEEPTFTASAEGQKLRIVHAPSNPAVKGTLYLEKALEQLKSEGYDFEYVRLVGMPFEQVQKEFKKADVIVDQLLLGAFGSVTIEGMSFGKPVVVFMLDELMEQFFEGMPIHNANIENIGDQLKELLDNPEKRKAMGLAGYHYVKKHFDTEQVGIRVKAVYNELLKRKA